MTTTTHINKDWRELPAGRELDRVVVELRGRHWVLDRQPEGEDWYLVDADGVRQYAVIGDEGRKYNTEELWKIALDEVYGYFDPPVPLVSTDANAAAQLWEAPHKPIAFIEVYRSHEDSEWTGDVSDDGEGYYKHKFTGKLADVLTRCWIAAKEQERES